MAATTPTWTRWDAAAVAAAPVVMFVAFVSHPFFPRLLDTTAVAEAVAGNTGRWVFAHVLTTVGSVLVAVAFVSIRTRLRDSGDRASAWGLPFVVFGSALYGFLPGLEFAPWAAVVTGGDAAAVQATLQPVFAAVLATSAITFLVGLAGFIRGIRHTAILSPRATGTVVVALAVMASARAVPLAVVQFHLQAVAGVAALLPLAVEMWRRPRSLGSVGPRRHDQMARSG